MNTVRRDGERLIMERSGSPPFALRAFSEAGFFAASDLTTYEFTRDASGKSGNCPD
jgi:hypothetical protein